MNDEMTAELKQAAQMALEALGVAMENLRPHGDNCFLHDEGEYARCFCGRDSVEGYLQSTVEALTSALTAPAQVPMTREQIMLLSGNCYDIGGENPVVTFARAVERFHGITQQKAGK